MKRLYIFLLLIALVALSCNQEKLIFYPEVLPADYRFSFGQNFEEMYFAVDKNTKVHGLLFPTANSKGLVFYLHGNAGALNSWGEIAGVYLQNKYDFFILDYRGYGKSEGEIENEKQFYHDLQVVYDSLKRRYAENKTVIIGYSIGTGPATWLAAQNKPKQLILKAPYYNLPHLAKQYSSLVPAFALKYRFRTNEWLPIVNCPVVIFHGNQDEVIPVESSYKLQKLFKPADKLIILNGQSHNGINNNTQYLHDLQSILAL